MGEKNKFEKFLSPWTFLFLNLVIVVLVEATGMFFMTTGLIHLIAILFIALGIGRIFVHYNVHDQFLNPLIYGGIATLLLYAISHVLEYVSYAYFSLPYETISINVVNFYLTGLFIIALSVSYFLKRLEKGFTFFSYLLPIGVALCVFATILFNLYPNLVNLGFSSWLLYLYAGTVIGVTILGISWLIRLKSHVSILANFIDYFNAAFIMIAGSAMFYILSESLVNIGVDYTQIMYVSHFLFYGALSMIFLSFGKLTHLGGLYDAAEEKE